MRQETYDKLVVSKYAKPAKFLEQLHLAGVPLDYLMTNDWETTYTKRVYVGKFYNRRNKVYRRFSDYDLTNAIKYYERVVK
jgi:hypothetical protein